jgi:hypothetical protein
MAPIDLPELLRAGEDCTLLIYAPLMVLGVPETVKMFPLLLFVGSL